VFRQGLRLRKGVTPVLAALLLMALVFVLFTSVGAQIESQAMNSLDFSAVRGCPDGIEQRLPSRVVLQYIDGVFHKWKNMISTKRDLLHLPEKTGTAPAVCRRGQDVLENSARWREQGPRREFRKPWNPMIPPTGEAVERSCLIISKSTMARPRQNRTNRPAGYPSKESRSSVQPERLSLPRPENVVGTDDRIRVTDTETYPWNTVGFIGNTYPSANSYRGSGAIVSPYMVLTAGHMVYNWDDEGGYVSSFNFSPVRDSC